MSSSKATPSHGSFAKLPDSAAEGADSSHRSGPSQTLRELVERFRVCWEVMPDCYFVNHQKRQIGFVLELLGTHEPGVEHPVPGCPHCHNVRLGLELIARWIIPTEKRDSDYDVVHYDQSIHYDRARNYRPDVSLRIWIRHRSGFDREMDACQVQCVNEMTQRLKQIGACEKDWGQTTKDSGEFGRSGSA